MIIWDKMVPFHNFLNKVENDYKNEYPQMARFNKSLMQTDEMISNTFKTYSLSKQTSSLAILADRLKKYTVKRRPDYTPPYKSKLISGTTYQPFITSTLHILPDFSFPYNHPAFAIQPIGCAIKLKSSNIVADKKLNFILSNIYNLPESVQANLTTFTDKRPYLGKDYLRLAKLEGFGLYHSDGAIHIPVYSETAREED